MIMHARGHQDLSLLTCPAISRETKRLILVIWICFAQAKEQKKRTDKFHTKLTTHIVFQILVSELVICCGQQHILDPAWLVVVKLQRSKASILFTGAC